MKPSIYITIMARVAQKQTDMDDNLILSLTLGQGNARNTVLNELKLVRLQETSDNIEKSVSTLTIDSTKLTTDVSTLKDDVSTLKGDVSTLKDDVSGLTVGQKQISERMDMMAEEFRSGMVEMMTMMRGIVK